LKTPKGGKAGIAAERLEDCASKADNPNIGSGIDAGYEENEAKSEIFKRPHHGVIVVCSRTFIVRRTRDYLFGFEEYIEVQARATELCPSRACCHKSLMAVLAIDLLLHRSMLT